MQYRYTIILLLLLSYFTKLIYSTSTTAQCINCIDSTVTESCPDPYPCGYKPSCIDCMSDMAMPQCPSPSACTASRHQCPMPSTFTISSTTCIWFNSLYITTTSDWMLCILLIFSVALIREYLVIYRTYRIQTRHNIKRKSSSTQSPRNAPPSTLLINNNFNDIYYNNIEFNCMAQTIDSMLYGLSLFISYMLMLLFMTYNVAVCVILVLSCTISHLIVSYTAYSSNIGTHNRINNNRINIAQADHCCDDINEH